MNVMFIAELAVLLQLDAFGMRPLVLAGRIIPLLAVGASQRNHYPHVFHLPGLPTS
jgi:hypothetical protein